MYTFKSTDSKEIEKCEKTGAIRSFFGQYLLEDKPNDYATKSKEDTCTSFLQDNKNQFKLDGITLVPVKETCEGSIIESITYQQMHHGVPVYGKEVVVGLDKKTQVISVVNQIDYELPDSLQPTLQKLTGKDALDIICKRCEKYSSEHRYTEPVLYIYRRTPIAPVSPKYNKSDSKDYMSYMLSLSEGKENEVYLVWQFLLDMKPSYGYWEILVDAIDGKIILVKDRCHYASRQAYVFEPDPATSCTNGNVFYPSNPSDLSDPSDQAMVDKINTLRKEVTLQNLDEPIGGVYSLNSKWIRSKEILPIPTSFSPPTTTTDFKYGIENRALQSVMAYYWVDKLIVYLRGFGITKYNQAIDATPLFIDAQANISEFVSPLEGSNEIPYIVFDENDVPGATDAHVIVHEYGHAIHWYMKKQQNDQGNEEGFGDFLAGVWLDRFNPDVTRPERNNVFPWDNLPTLNSYDPERYFNTLQTFSPQGFAGVEAHANGSVLAAALWKMYLLMGGADLQNIDKRKAAADKAIYLYLETLVCLAKNSTVIQLVRCLINTDLQLFRGENEMAIRQAFTSRGLAL